MPEEAAITPLATKFKRGKMHNCTLRHAAGAARANTALGIEKGIRTRSGRGTTSGGGRTSGGREPDGGGVAATTNDGGNGGSAGSTAGSGAGNDDGAGGVGRAGNGSRGGDNESGGGCLRRSLDLAWREESQFTACCHSRVRRRGEVRASGGRTNRHRSVRRMLAESRAIEQRKQNNDAN